jgi:hypothetical protein
MYISEIKTKSEIKTCVDMYFNYAKNDDFMECDLEFAYANLDTAVRLKKYVRALRDETDSSIIAWIYADTGKSMHSKKKTLQQHYYASNQKGLKAYRCIQLLHRDLIIYAEEKGFEIVASAGSHLDGNNTYTRILEKLGWIRRNYLAIYKTSLYK